MTLPDPGEKLHLYLLLACTLILGCSQQHNADNSAKVNQEQSEFQCPEQRPEICTQDYNPVCATRDTGIRCITTPCPSSEQLTFANSCSACTDPKVFSYTPGACSPAGTQ